MFKKSIGIFFEKTLGDIIYTSSIISSIRDQEPEAYIHIVTSSIGLEILKSSNPDYNEISTKFKNLINYDIIYYPLRCLQAVPYWFIHKKHATELACESIGRLWSKKKTNIINPDNENINNLCRDISEFGYIIISNKASSDKLKEVPLDVLNKAIEKIRTDFKGPIYQIGLSKDPPMHSCDLTFLGQTTIIDSLYLIKHAYMTIAIDNYINHAAGAYKVPSIGIYGQYSAIQVRPVDEHPLQEIIDHGKLGEYNINGCNKVTNEEIFNKYMELKGKINANS